MPCLRNSKRLYERLTDDDKNILRLRYAGLLLVMVIRLKIIWQLISMIQIVMNYGYTSRQL